MTVGDAYVVNGSKIWTTLAPEATHIFCLVRTSIEARPQRGITFLLIEMDRPGVTVRPIVNLAGDHEFNQVFFDGVRVPLGQRLGEEGQGWAVAKHLLEFERRGNYTAGRKAQIAALRALIRRRRPDDIDLRRGLAQADMDVTAVDLGERRLVSDTAIGEAAGTAASVLTLQGGELIQRLDQWARAAVGPDACPLDEDARVAMDRYLYDRSVTIFGGTSEIQKNIISRARLNL